MGLFKRSLNSADYLFDLRWAYKPKPQEGYAEESYTFRQMYIQYVQLMAKGWFGDEEVHLKDVFANSKDVNLEAITPVRPEGEINLFDEIGVQTKLLNTAQRFENAERISWEKSKLGHKWFSKLSDLGVNLFVVPSPQNPNIQVITGPWKLFDNETPFPIFGEIWRDKSTGEDFIYWFFDALVRTRYPLPTKGKHPSDAFFIPAMFQRLGYLSETIFPSSMVRIKDRLGEFATDNPSHIPALAFHNERDYGVLSLQDDGQEISQRVDWSPQTLRYGYIIDDTIPFLENSEIIPKVVDALPKAVSILMDGFCNWTDSEEIRFQDELFLDYDLDGVKPEQFELSFFVAGPAYGRLCWKGMMVYNNLRQLQDDTKELLRNDRARPLLNQGYATLINRGCGSIFMHSINTFYFSVGKIRREEIAAFTEEEKMGPRKILRFASTYPVDNQDANALSNLAVYELLWKEYENSLAITNEGLAKLEVPLLPIPSDAWRDIPENRLPIKLELLLTKARALVGLGRKGEAKSVLEQLEREAIAANFDGWEYTEGKELLSTL